MTETDDGPSPDDIASILEQAPGKAATAETIAGHLEMKGIDTTPAEVRRLCNDLVEYGMLEPDEPETNRYHLVDRGAQ